MIKLAWLLIFIFSVSFCSAQIPPIVWQKTFGNSGNEVLHSIVPTADGKYMVMGIADVNGSDVSCGLKGLHDVWVYKMSANGNIIWQQCFGGTQEEANPYNRIIATSDGGSLFISESWSKDFDAADHHKLSDVLTVKLDATGNVQWKHSFGGKKLDVPRSIVELPGQRYAIVSRSTSHDGDVPSNLDPVYFDAWVFILDADGNIISNHIYGGTGDDDLHKVLLDADGNLVLFGFTASHDGDLAGLDVNGTDAWVLKIDTLGNVLSSKVYGQQNGEEFYDALKTSDGYLAFGITGDPAMPVDKGSYHGDDDLWAVKLDNAFNLQWQGVYGGSERETMMQAVAAPVNSGFYLAGGTYSADGDVVKPSGNGNDEYIIKIANDGSLLWAVTHGGSKKDYANSITSTGIVVGVAYSTDGDVLNSEGNGDGWVYKFKDKMSVAEKQLNNFTSSDDFTKVDVYPNPATEQLTLEFSALTIPLNLEVVDLTGRIVYHEIIAEADEDFTISIETRSWSEGIYLVKITGENIFQTTQLVITH